MPYTHIGMRKIPFQEALERYQNNKEAYLLYDDNTEAVAESEEAIRYHHDEFQGEFGVDMGGSEDREYVNQMVSEWKPKSTEEQFAFCNQLSSEIQAIDNKEYAQDERKPYSYRNTLVQIKRELQKDLPFRYAIHDSIFVFNGKRRIKGIVMAHIDPAMRTVEIRPQDKVYKESFIVSESALYREEEIPAEPFEDDVQGTLFDEF